MVDPRLAVIAVTLDAILATPNLPEANIFEHAQPPRVPRRRDNRAVTAIGLPGALPTRSRSTARAVEHEPVLDPAAAPPHARRDEGRPPKRAPFPCPKQPSAPGPWG
jgi:hypothetical protein